MSTVVQCVLNVLRELTRDVAAAINAEHCKCIYKNNIVIDLVCSMCNSKGRH